MTSKNGEAVESLWKKTYESCLFLFGIPIFLITGAIALWTGDFDLLAIGSPFLFLGIAAYVYYLNTAPFTPVQREGNVLPGGD